MEVLINKAVIDSHIIEPHLNFEVNCAIEVFRSEVRGGQKCILELNGAIEVKQSCSLV